MTPVRVVLPAHLRHLARVSGEVTVVVPGRVSLAGVLDALEELHPVLRGTVRDQRTQARRAFVRFYACEQDLSHDDVHAELAEDVRQGREPLLIIGAMAGG